MTAILSIKFYTKPKCSLCDEVRVFLTQLKKTYPLSVEEINILDDPDLYERYKYEIPVLLFPDQSQLQGRIDGKKLKAKLEESFHLKS
jgi:thiol-disulfide isomerase/thioredoxin